jgi:hypothetical protein
VLDPLVISAHFIASGTRAAGSLPSWDSTTAYAAGDMIHPDCYG